MNIMKKFCKEILPYILIVLVVILIKTFLVAPVKVNGLSMYKTLHDGDIMLLNKVVYKVNPIKRGDIVVASWNNEYIIKRVIGLPGDKVEFKDNTLYVNDKKIDEKYVNGKTEDFDIKMLGASKVPKGYYLILGDNREDSYDSRKFGFMSKKDILGRCKVTIFPFNRISVKG